MISNALPKHLKILVTGATGFIGGHLAHRLGQEGYEVHAMYRASTPMPTTLSSNIRWHRVDSTDDSVIKAVKNCRPDLTFHFAAHFVPPQKEGAIHPLVSSQILFGTQILEGMSGDGIKYFINSGTPWEATPGYSLYAAMKTAFESVLKHYTVKYNWRTVTLRPYDVYGQNDLRNKVTNQILKAIAHAQSLDLSPGQQKLNLVHVSDVVSAYLHAATALYKGSLPNLSTYEIRTCEEISLQELVALCENVAETPCLANWGKLPYRANEVMHRWRGGSELPNWTPQISLKDGLKEMWSELQAEKRDQSGPISMKSAADGRCPIPITKPSPC